MENNSQEIEEWRSIEGYEGLYQVSSLGRVRSCDRHVSNGKGIRLLKGKVLKSRIGKHGYLIINLSKDNKLTTFNVHRLVGKAFPEICGEYRKGLEIDHRNCVRDDNRAENLHWVTRKENNNNPLTKQNMSCAKKGDKCCLFGKFWKKHPSSKPIIQLDLESNFIAEFDGLRDAERKLGICHAMISSCCRGKTKTTHGYIFCYKTA